MTTEQVYQELCQTMIRRGGYYPAMDIPEFFQLAEELFTPDEAHVSNAMPKGFFTAQTLADTLQSPEAEIMARLEAMADRGLCLAVGAAGQRIYAGPPFVPGIFEYQFLRGTSTDRDYRLARLIHAYKKAVDARRATEVVIFPRSRVIAVNRMVKSGTRVHTYDQVSTYIEKYDPISVGTCFCRHEAKLVEGQDCGRPNDVCMQFGVGAQFVADRGMGRIVSKPEAHEILKRAEEAGLVHCSVNTQEIDFICNCCSCHCMIIKSALAQPKPGLILYSSFQPTFDAEACTACETCIEHCPAQALTLGPEDVPVVNLDRCFGCGICATGCPAEAAILVERPTATEPPENRKALKSAIAATEQRSAS